MESKALEEKSGEKYDYGLVGAGEEGSAADGVAGAGAGED